jgi:hypothetical protein
MKSAMLKLRRLGIKQLIALSGSGMLAAAAIALVFTPRPELGIVPVAVLLLHLTLQVVLLQSRMVFALRDIGRIRANEKKLLSQQRGRASTAPVTEDILALFERVEFLQKRVLAAVEAERVEAAERQQVLLKNRSIVQ